MSSTDDLPLPMDDMPPLPPLGATGPQACATVRLYLAVIDDLPPEQVAMLNEHVRTCADCAREQPLLQHVTSQFANLPASAPSAHVNEAIMAAIAARSQGQKLTQADGQDKQNRFRRGIVPARFFKERTGAAAAFSRPQDRRGQWYTRKAFKISAVILATAAVLFLTLSMTLHFFNAFTPPASQVFHLPANLSWSGYVLYHSETRIDAQGERYNVETYYDLGTGQMHVETRMDGSLDVVAVGDSHKMLGLDMMHHVAQWDAEDWSVDESAFDLPELRSDLAANRAQYLDEDVFKGQTVYRIRCRNGLVLLLNMRYQPVNVLRGAVGQGTGEPIYDTLKLMPSSTVTDSMWDMNVPNGFKMGTLPQKPQE